jgi:hypothetical protein
MQAVGTPGALMAFLPILLIRFVVKQYTARASVVVTRLERAYGSCRRLRACSAVAATTWRC